MFSASAKRITSPITYPSGVHGTKCFALSTTKPSKLLTARSERSCSASGPVTARSAMWYDWLKSTQVRCHAIVSSRQFVYSAGTPG